MYVLGHLLLVAFLDTQDLVEFEQQILRLLYLVQEGATSLLAESLS